VKARARFIDGFVHFGNRRDRTGAAAFGDANGTGAPKARLLLAAFAALAATLVLGVALAGAVAPVVTVEDADDVEYTTAQVEGEVNPEGHETSFHFEYITDEQYLANEANSEPLFQGASEVGHGSTEVTVSPSESLSGLKPATEYHLRLVASNNEGETAEAVATSTFTTKAVAKPIVSGLTASETHFSGMVNPNAPEAAPASDAVKAGFNTHWSFTCSPDCSFSGPSEGDLEADNSATEVSADPVNLTPNQTYDVTLHATNAGGEETETITSAFTTPGLPPAIGKATLFEPTATSIVLAGTVNPHNSPLSDCHFAYGQAGNFDLSAPCESPLPEGEGIREVRAAIEGLDPGTEYNFRLIATNGFGTTEGTIRTFRTFPERSPSTACSNEAIRVAQHVTQLGDCRAFEKVTPNDKGGGDIAAGGRSTDIAAADGNAAVFASLLGFADSQGSGAGGRITYLSRRSSAGWATHAVTPRSNPEANLVAFTGTYHIEFSDDLTHAVVKAYELPGATGDTPERVNLYRQGTADRSLETITGSETGEGDPIKYDFPEFISENTWGSSSDLDHVSFETAAQLVPAIPGEYPNGSPNAYTWDEGEIHLAGILPDGTVPAGGSSLPRNYRGGVSADGSRLIFTAAPSGASQIYLRIDHNHTDLVSESENENLSEEPQDVRFQGMTPDGRVVFFTTTSPLLEGDTAPGPDLYRWTEGPDPAHEANLTLITNTGGLIESGSTQMGLLVGMSDDGSRAYFVTSAGEMVVWEEGETSVVDTSYQFGISKHWNSPAVLGASAGYARVSSDGNWLAYVHPERDNNMYLYNRATGTRMCASCPGRLVTGRGDLSFETNLAINAGGEYPNYRPRYLSPDGTVYFTTAGSLLPSDTNGVADVYSYDGPTGRLDLVSPGTGSGASEFVDASTSGDDVFFITRNQLVPSDTDDYVDLYDARVGGGFAESAAAVPPCSGEECQGPVAAPQALAPAASAAATRGNVKKSRPCAKNRRKVRRHGKVRCVKRHRAQKMRDKPHAGSTRGGAK
jgi:hypothetical protein